MNGSILIVALQPSFTILHTLTTARAPSPIANLAWHASSTKQKSDMLATQTSDGDLRVWSVSKPPTAETPKTIRVLKRTDNVEPGINWMAWSKNGRILQHSDGLVDAPRLESFSYGTTLLIVHDNLERHGLGTSEQSTSPANQYLQSKG